MEPVDGPVTQEFGMNAHFAWQLGYGHLGRDYGCNVGSVVRAIAPGTVLWADWGQRMPAGLANENMFIPGSPNSGICVVVQHDGWRSVDAHLNSTHLNTGDRVVRGQELGRSGNTGNSTGPHLHFETFLAPSPGTPPFGRYNPVAQIALENRVAGGTAPAPAPAPTLIAPNERMVGNSTVFQRAAPNTDAAIVRNIEPRTKERWDGYVRGQTVTVGGHTSDVWYKDNQGYAWSGGFVDHSTNGLPDLTPGLAPNQRRVIPQGAVQRAAPGTGAAHVRDIVGSTVETFTHWARGERVNQDGVDTDIWYKDNLGYVWAGRFEARGTDGLPEFVSIAANQRLAGPGTYNQRDVPFTSGRVVRTIAPGTLEVFTHWARGEKVRIGDVETDVWFGDVHGYVWAGSFTDQGTHGLLERPASTPLPAPLPTTPAPVPGPDYVVVKAFDIVTDVRPAAPGNFERRNFPAPANVAAIFVHQFNADEVADNPTVNKTTVHIGSVINTFQGSGRVASAHFAVEGLQIVQFLNLDDRAYAQGSPANGEGWSIETYGAQDPVTMATVAKLIQALEELGGIKQLRRHKEVMATKCGNGIDIAQYRRMVDALKNPPAPVPTPVPDTAAESLLRKIMNLLIEFFAGRK